MVVSMRVAAQIPRTVRVQNVIKEHAGGTQSQAAVAQIDGDTRFLKSARPSHHGSSPNFESEFLAHDIFELFGIDAPDAEMVSLHPESPLYKELGPTVLSTEFVDEEFSNGSRVRGGGWGPPEGAAYDDFFHMTLIDMVIGNADRRGANYFVMDTERGVVPVPIDNNSGFGNLTTQKYATNHCNFILSYDGAGASPGIRQNGKIANHFIDTMLHHELLDEPHEKNRILELAQNFQSTLTDQRIEDMVERLPRAVIPDDARVEFALPPGIDPVTKELLSNGAEEGLSGDQLFLFRKSQIKETLRWRRDHLPQALESYFREVENPAIDPLEACSQDWNLMMSGGA
jgi:hypothetical protein